MILSSEWILMYNNEHITLIQYENLLITTATAAEMTKEKLFIIVSPNDIDRALLHTVCCGLVC